MNRNGFYYWIIVDIFIKLTFTRPEILLLFDVLLISKRKTMDKAVMILLYHSLPKRSMSMEFVQSSWN